MTDYPTIEFGSLDELCSQIRELTAQWPDPVWFRGAKSPTYSLTPKLFRTPDTAGNENFISVEFRRRARSHLPNIQSQFEWLCAMQHYGVPTRLLDWTESFAVALYFTVRPAQIAPSIPTIWALNPFALFELSDSRNKGRIIPIATNKEVRSNSDLAFDDEVPEAQNNVTELPIPVAPDFLFPRLSIQNGNFTIHGRNQSPIENLIPTNRRSDILRKFVAKSDQLTSIYENIKVIIPSADSIFPDIEGLKDYIA